MPSDGGGHVNIRCRPKSSTDSHTVDTMRNAKSGGISNDGKHIDLAATTMIRILAGNAGAVRLLINGVGIGFMGADGAVVEWQIARTGD